MKPSDLHLEGRLRVTLINIISNGALVQYQASDVNSRNATCGKECISRRRCTTGG